MRINNSNRSRSIIDHENEGFSLPIAVLAGLLLLIGSLSLASRSGWGLFGSAFQNKNWAARSAAETGMNTIVNELNRPINRWLNIVREGDPDYQNSNSGDLWVKREGNLRQNPCVPSQDESRTNQEPDFSLIDPLNATTTIYGKWYIDKQGNISPIRGDSDRSFRVTRIERQLFAANAGSNQIDINNDGKINELDRYLSVWRDRIDFPTSGVGAVTIQVEGQSYQGGRVISSITLERTYELTPKCCGIPFGGKHGNIDYSVQRSGASSGTSACLDNLLGLGLLAGTKGDDTGTVEVRGRATDVENQDGDPINPIYCLASNDAGCSINNKDPDISVAIIDILLPKAFEYCNPKGGTEIYLSNPCTNNSAPTGKLSDIPLDPECSGASIFKKGFPCREDPKQPLPSVETIVYDFSAPERELPSFCSVSDTNEAHCNISGPFAPDQSPKTNSIKNIYFVTGSRKVRLYFPGIRADCQSADGCEEFDDSGKGNLTISNCSRVVASTTNVNCIASENITDLSLFGSNSQNAKQSLTIGGTQDASNLFIYFPGATVQLTGNASFSGVLWTNNLTSIGNPTWVIPSSGLTEALKLMGFTDSRTGEIEPPLYDFVLRGINRQRWLSG